MSRRICSTLAALCSLVVLAQASTGPRPKINSCNSHPCRNNATCIPYVNEHGGQFNCTCAPGFTGRECETSTRPRPKINSCNSHPCRNNATCIPYVNEHGGQFNCTCAPGFTGRECERNVSATPGEQAATVASPPPSQATSLVVPIFNSTSPKKVEIGANTSFLLTWQGVPEEALVSIYGDWLKVSENGTDYGKIVLEPRVFEINGSGSILISVATSAAGKFDVDFNTSSGDDVISALVSDLQVEVDVVHSTVISIINVIIGWVYFSAWSVSFYPQIFTNWRRKSVIGLNFDFLSYNIMGFFFYGLFNVGLFWIPEIQHEFQTQHPHSVNPVQANDVAFTLHAVAATALTIVQAIIYERGDQRVSNVARVLVGLSFLMVFVMLFVAIGHKITWLFYLYLFSYVKLGVTLIKYVPQAWMNYRRKSTVGWSIGNVLLDFTGGSLSMLQMLLMGYNYDDWKTVFNDPTKFGLGMFSVLFDILFMVQHYILYRHYRRYESIPAVNNKHDDSYAHR